MFRRVSIIGATACLLSTGAWAGAPGSTPPGICSTVPNYDALKNALSTAVSQAHGVPSANRIGFLLNMWATVVAADGTVCAVTNSGGSAIQGQWLASRVISAQKANTANDLSLGVGNGPAPIAPAGFAISTANLYSPTQPGGSLFGLQESNPVTAAGAYGDTIAGFARTANYGTPNDPMVGLVIGGINVFGGGLGLYDATHKRAGGVGVSGDTSCMDHIVAWYLRKQLGFDHLAPASGSGPAGIAGFAAAYASVGTPPGPDTQHPDNIIFDITASGSASGYGHPVCKGAFVAPFPGAPAPLSNAEAEAMVLGLPAVIP